MNKKEYKLTPDAIRAIERALAHDDRAEVIPVKDGVRVFRMRREEVKARTDENTG